MQPAKAELRHQAESPQAGRSQVFREVNERIRALTTAASGTARREFICECADPGCLDIVPLTLAQYDAIRRIDHAVLAPRHHDHDRLDGTARRPRRLRQA